MHRRRRQTARRKGSGRSLTDQYAHSIQQQRCPRCQSHTAFCVSCSAQFHKTVPEELSRQLAFGADIEEEFQQMLRDLRNRVDEKSLANRHCELYPGSSQTSKQRRQTKALVLEGLCIDNIAQNIERDMREKSGLLVKQSPIDVMPAGAVQWLAGIDDATRSWIYMHNERILTHDRWLQSRAAREIRRQDCRIDTKADSLGVASLNMLAISESNRLAAGLQLSPALVDIKRKIVARANSYITGKT